MKGFCAGATAVTLPRAAETPYGDAVTPYAQSDGGHHRAILRATLEVQSLTHSPPLPGKPATEFALPERFYYHRAGLASSYLTVLRSMPTHAGSSVGDPVDGPT